jgi:hypothetical protein
VLPSKSQNNTQINNESATYKGYAIKILCRNIPVGIKMFQVMRIIDYILELKHVAEK